MHIEKDNKGNIIHAKTEAGYEIWYEYDERNKCIYSKDTDGRECWFGYSLDGKIEFFKEKDKRNIINYRKFNSDGGYLHYRNYNGSWEIQQFDVDYNLICMETSTGYFSSTRPCNRVNISELIKETK